MGRHRSDDNRWLWAGLAVLVALGTVAVAWADHLGAAGSTVSQNVTYGQIDMSRATAAEVDAVVAARATELLATPVEIDTGESRLVFSADEVGFGYDEAAARRAILSARHRGNMWDQISSFFAAPFQPIAISDYPTFDASRPGQLLASDPRVVLAEPVEPEIVMRGAEMTAIPGQPGRRVDLTGLSSELESADILEGPLLIEAGQITFPPSVSDEAAEIAAAHLNQATVNGAEFLIGDSEVWLPPPTLRGHISVAVGNGDIEVGYDGKSLHRLLEGMRPGPAGPFARPTFDVARGEVIVVREGEVPPVCCDPDSVQRAGNALIAGQPGPFAVETRPSDDPRHLAWASGEDIKEVVGEFTTHHSCCAARVTNIHRIADLVRGAYLLPGETISLNEHVGPRTREKGFVPAGAIRFGRLNPEVGGGVSQFATTIFNAAYFAGLELLEYRSHSLYFPRYPFGREATISNPQPDLVFGNTTNYPVLFWATYDDTSITASIYSTRHIEVVEQRQRSWKRNQCTHVETDRQRTYPDGRVVVDTIIADYRPAEGLDCNGNEIPIPPGN